MKEEIRIFFTALMFYTRIPCPSWVDHSEDYINKATRYFPLIGWIVGGASALVFLGGDWLLDIFIAVILSMVASVWITGAFHEDGLADVCDGFGGGWTKEKILTIMKDSRLGTYGAAGLFFILLLKLFLLVKLGMIFHGNPFIILLVFVSGHSLSRFTASTFIFTHPYARDDASSKVKPVAKQPDLINLWIGVIFMLIPLLGLSLSAHSALIWLVIFPVYGMKVYLANFFTKRIEGYTGDCLGATQQLCEITFYMSLIILCKFI